MELWLQCSGCHNISFKPHVFKKNVHVFHKFEGSYRRTNPATSRGFTAWYPGQVVILRTFRRWILGWWWSGRLTLRVKSMLSLDTELAKSWFERFARLLERLETSKGLLLILHVPMFRQWQELETLQPISGFQEHNTPCWRFQVCYCCFCFIPNIMGIIIPNHCSERVLSIPDQCLRRRLENTNHLGEQTKCLGTDLENLVAMSHWEPWCWRCCLQWFTCVCVYIYIYTHTRTL